VLIAISAERCTCGFALVELLVALVILGIALSIAAPALRRPPAGSERTASQLVLLLHHARRAATEHGRTAIVELDLTRRLFRVRMEATDSQRDSLLAEGQLPQFGDIVPVHQDAGAWVLFRFDPFGRAEGGPVRIRHENGRATVVGVDPWTGAPHVQE